MSDDKLNDLLQKWAAARIRFSSEYGRRHARLAKIMNKISEVERERQPSPLESAPQTKAPSSGRMLRKGPSSAKGKLGSKIPRGAA